MAEKKITRKQNELADQLLDAAHKNNTTKIRSLIKKHKFLLNYKYVLEGGMTILLIACSNSEISADTVGTLLDINADPGAYTEGDCWAAIHWTANATDFETLHVLLEKNPEIINAVDTYANNALHIIIRYGKTKSPDFQKCVELLLDKGIDVDQTNVKNLTPIEYAVSDDLSSHIIELMKNKVGANIREADGGRILLGYLKKNDVEKFVSFNDGNIKEWVDYTEESHTLLQMSCEKDLTEAAIHLLEQGAICDKTSKKKNKQPITMAAERGNKKIFRALLDKYSQITEMPRELLPTIVKYIDNKYHDNIGCYEVFMEKMDEWKEAKPDEVSYILNQVDDTGNTALHYAVVYAEPEVVENLLRLGASLGARNHDGVMPIKHIDLDILKNHLNTCVEYDLEKRKTHKNDFEVKFNYRTLIPPYLQKIENNVNVSFDKDVVTLDVQPNSAIKEKLVAETEVINFMSQTSELKDLLTHPTITSYLYLKWLKLQWIFWINLACYGVFAGSLLIYIHIDLKTDKSTSWYIAAQIFHMIFSIGSLVMLFRELIQIIVEPRKYFWNIENYMELSLTGLSAMIALDLNLVCTKKELFALATLLLAFELVLLLGHHPMFSTNVVMFRKVSYNFYKFLLWYSLPIIAFAISFYLVLTVGNEVEPFAPNLFHSLFKTIIMLTGEFNSGDFNFDIYPHTSKLLFLTFVFSIAIILLNLLSGLAVSDTQMIQDQAELIGYVVRTQFITGIETALIGNIPILTYVQKLIYGVEIPIDKDWSSLLGQFLLRLSCIFPDYFNYEVTFYPRKQGSIKIPNLIHSRVKQVKYSNVCLDYNSVQKTNNIIQENINDIIQKRNSSITRIENKIDLILTNIGGKLN